MALGGIWKAFQVVVLCEYIYWDVFSAAWINSKAVFVQVPLNQSASVGKTSYIPMNQPEGSVELPNNPTVLDYDPVDDRLYFFDIIKKIIYRMFINGSNIEQIVHLGVGRGDTRGISVDFVGRNLYWTEKLSSKIEVSKLNGSQRSTVIRFPEDSSLEDIVVHSIKGTMFWIDSGRKLIQKSSTDGKFIQNLVNTNLNNPFGLSHDATTDKLFWSDLGSHALEYISSNGQNRGLLIRSQIYMFWYVLAVDKFLYWSDHWRHHAVLRISMNESDGRETSTFLSIQNPYLTGIAIIKEKEEIPCSCFNPCDTHNGGCSHMCLRGYNNFHSCACPEGMVLWMDNRTCDINECESKNGGCHSNATCINLFGSFQCACLQGFTGDGFRCSDIDECSYEAYVCHSNASCENTVGGYSCKCQEGFSGSGKNCSDLNECEIENGGCHPNATCINLYSSHRCQCDAGFEGNGRSCLITRIVNAKPDNNPVYLPLIIILAFIAFIFLVLLIIFVKRRGTSHSVSITKENEQKLEEHTRNEAYVPSSELSTGNRKNSKEKNSDNPYYEVMDEPEKQTMHIV